MTGYVYLVSSEEQDLIKIGYCGDNPHGRLASMQTGNPSPLKLVNYVEGTRAVEGALHEVLADYRVRGEWFREPEMVRLVFSIVQEDAIDDDDIYQPVTPAQAKRSAKEALLHWFND